PAFRLGIHFHRGGEDRVNLARYRVHGYKTSEDRLLSMRKRRPDWLSKSGKNFRRTDWQSVLPVRHLTGRGPCRTARSGRTPSSAWRKRRIRPTPRRPPEGTGRRSSAA